MKPKPSKPREVERVARKLGFTFDRQKGSHRVFKHSDGRNCVIADHPGDVPTGTLKNIIRQMGLTIEEFNGMV